MLAVRDLYRCTLRKASVRFSVTSFWSDISGPMSISISLAFITKELWLVRSQKASASELGSDSLSIEESRSTGTGVMAFQVTKLTNIIPSVQDAFSGLVFTKHEEARYAFPRVSLLNSPD